MPKSIMIADDSPLVRRELRNLFARSRGWNICAEAVDGRDAVDQARHLPLHLDLVVLNSSLPFLDGVQVAHHLKNLSPTTSIVMLTAFKDRMLEEKAYKAGVSWVIPKAEVPKILDFARILMKEVPGGGLAPSD